MLSCKQVSKALLEQNYHTLPPWKQKLLKLHISLCRMCGQYNGQIVDLQDGVSRFVEQEDRLPPSEEDHLPEEAKARLAARLKALDPE